MENLAGLAPRQAERSVVEEGAGPAGTPRRQHRVSRGREFAADPLDAAAVLDAGLGEVDVALGDAADTGLDDIDLDPRLIVLPADAIKTTEPQLTKLKKAMHIDPNAFLQTAMAGPGGMSPNGQPSRQVALSLTALCLGGMVLARAIEDRKLAEELREATMAVAMQLGDFTIDPSVQIG